MTSQPAGPNLDPTYDFPFGVCARYWRGGLDRDESWQPEARRIALNLKFARMMNTEAVPNLQHPKNDKLSLGLIGICKWDSSQRSFLCYLPDHLKSQSFKYINHGLSLPRSEVWNANRHLIYLTIKDRTHEHL